MWEFCDHIPNNISTPGVRQGISRNLLAFESSSMYFIHATYWSADLVQRSMLFNCVETKSSCMLVSVIASAVFSVNSGQLISGKSKSAASEGVISMQEVFTILTFQSYKCLWWIISIEDFGKINCLKSPFSIFLCLVPLICIFHIAQVSIFIDYLTIKFGEYNHQWNCEWTTQESVHCKFWA